MAKHLLRFRDGTVSEIDEVAVLRAENRHLRFVIAEMERQRTEGRGVAHANLVAGNIERDCNIASDELFLQLALKRRNREDLEALLAECGVPKAKWPTFKAENITAVLAKKHGLSKPRIRTIIKNWKAR